MKFFYTIIKMSRIKSSYFVIICLLLTILKVKAKDMENEPIEQ